MKHAKRIAITSLGVTCLAGGFYVTLHEHGIVGFFAIAGGLLVALMGIVVDL